jgi:hypothetical protein
MFIPIWIVLVGGALTVLGALFVLDRLGVWAERRGWIYWRKARPKTMGRAVLGAVQEFVEPEIRNVIEAQQQDRVTIDIVDRQNDGTTDEHG